MKAIVIRDKTLDWFERICSGPWLERTCRAVCLFAALYFGTAVVRGLFG